MNQTYQSSAQLKELSKGQLEGKYSLFIGLIVIIRLITGATSVALKFLFPTNTFIGLILYWGATYVVSVFLDVFTIGTTLFGLNIVCHRKCSISDMFYGFKNHFEKSLALSFAVTSIFFVAQIPLLLPTLLIRYGPIDTALLLSIPLLLAGIVIFFYVTLLFSQVYYLFLDFPTYSVGEILKLSCRIMKGNMGRLLYVKLSFLPLALLSAFTCGIGLLFLTPYRDLTFTNFYLDIMQPKQ